MSASVSMPLGGVQVGSYENYQQAQRAVDFLSDEKFPVENVTIIGSDLRMVERVTGRLSWGRAIGAGAASGAWFGLFVGLLLGIFATDGSDWIGSVLSGLLIGLVFGAVFGAVGLRGLAGQARLHQHQPGGGQPLRRAVQPAGGRAGARGAGPALAARVVASAPADPEGPRRCAVLSCPRRRGGSRRRPARAPRGAPSRPSRRRVPRPGRRSGPGPRRPSTAGTCTPCGPGSARSAACALATSSSVTGACRSCASMNSGMTVVPLRCGGRAARSR